MGYHMITDLQGDLFEVVTQAKLTYIPWIRQSAILERDISKDDWVKDPPYDCDVEKLAVEIEEQVPENAPLAYLNLETPMLEPFGARSLACYQDAIGIAKDLRPRTQWGVYSMVHKPMTWRTTGVSWTNWLNGVYPLCDFACPSLYPRSGRWSNDPAERWRMDVDISWLVLSDQNAFRHLAFVRPRWKSNGGDGRFVPLDWFTNWLLSLDRRGIAVCLFMDSSEQENMVEQFTPYIQVVGSLTAEINSNKEQSCQHK